MKNIFVKIAQILKNINIVMKSSKTVEEAMLLSFPDRWWHRPDLNKIAKDSSSALNPIFYEYKNLDNYCDGLKNCLLIYRNLPEALLNDFDNLKNAKVPIRSREVAAFLRRDIYLHHVFVRFALYLKDDKNPLHKSVTNALTEFNNHCQWSHKNLFWMVNINDVATDLISNKHNVDYVLGILNK